MASSKKLSKRRGAGRPPDSELERHKDAILEAATKVFLERGFERTSMAEIARRAGASKGTLYSLYPTKEALYIGLLRRRVANAVNPISEPVRDDVPVEDVLEAFGRSLLSWVSSDEARQLYRLVVAESGRFPELGVACWENGPGRGRLVLKAYLDKTVEQGILTIENTDRAALHFLSMMTGMPVIRGSLKLSPFTDADDTFSEWIKSAVQMFIRAYRATPPILTNSHSQRKLQPRQK